MADTQHSSEGCLGFFALAQHAAGELAEPARSQAAAHIAACERCSAALAEIEQDRAAYEPLADAGYAAAWQASQLPEVVEPREAAEARAPERSRRRRWRWPTLFKVMVPVAAAAAVAAVVIPRLIAPPPPGGGDPPGSTYVAYKGALALQVVAKRGERQFVVAPEQRMCPGDALRFSVTAARAGTHVAVFSLDSRKALSTFYPNASTPASARSTAGKTVVLAKPGRNVLPGSIVLDETLGREVIVLLAASASFDPAPLAARVKALLARTPAAAATLDAAQLGLRAGAVRALVIHKARCK